MDIRNKVLMDREGLEKNGPITIVAFGDSVTHGAVGDGEMDYESVYWNRLRLMINEAYPYVPVNVINAGIGGITAKLSLGRFDKQVLSHDPDLVIVCFGLNDVNGPLEDFLIALEEIFRRCVTRNIETVYMTPNMLYTYVREGEVAEQHLKYAAKTAELQSSGRMDTFMEKSADLARHMGVTVCDCYSRWKELSLTQDTTLLLANRINHPIREMHQLFADELYRVIFPDRSQAADESTMYEEK